MLTSPPAVLLLLALLADASATAQPPLPSCEASPHRIELLAAPTDKAPEVCISPDLPTTFRFDSPLPPGAVELQERERFEDVSTGTRSITVIPPEGLRSGERLKLVVRFTDGAAPTSATFELVGHPARAARQVEVFRNRRTIEDYQQEVQEKEARIRQLQTELVRTQAEGSGLGITGLIASGLLKVDTKNVQGVLAKNVKSTITMPSANALLTSTVISYRSTTKRGEKGADVMRVAVAMVMDNPGTAPWTARDAALLVGKGQDVKEAKVLQLAPIPPGGSGLVMVETELRWCERTGRPGDCLRLLTESPTVNGDGHFALGMALAKGAVLDEMLEAFKDMADPHAMVAAVLWTWTTYMILVSIPDVTISKGLAAVMTATIISYVGVDTFWGLVVGFKRLMDEADRATSFNELRAAGERYGKLMGRNAARAFAMLAMAAIGDTAPGLAAKVPKLPGSMQAAVQAETQVGIRLAAVGEVKTVAVSAESVSIALAPGAVAMTMRGRQTSSNPSESIKSLKARLAEHRQKLADYKANPDAFDNQGILRNAPSPEVRQRIINGRIKHLEDEIRAFEKAIRDLGGEP